MGLAESKLDEDIDRPDPYNMLLRVCLKVGCKCSIEQDYHPQD